jgi:hypothetical protein
MRVPAESPFGTGLYPDIDERNPLVRVDPGLPPEALTRRVSPGLLVEQAGTHAKCCLGVCYGTACAGLSSFFGSGANQDVLREQNTLLNGGEGNECQPPYLSCSTAGSEMNRSM